MTILFYITIIKDGGAERVLNTLSNTLAKRGHHIHIAVSQLDKTTFEWDSRIAFHDLNYPKCKSKIQLIRNVWGAFHLSKRIREIAFQTQPDIAVCFSVGLAMYVQLNLSRQFIYISSEHRNFSRKIQNHSRWVHFQRTVINRFADAVILLTQYDKTYTSKFLKNTVVIPNPLPFTALTTPEFTESDSLRKNILICGRLDRWKDTKGFDYAISAFASIAREFPNIDLDIAGQGNEKTLSEIHTFIQQKKLTNRVHFLGFSKDMKEVYKSHKIFILSSKFEGFPLVLMEALSMGCVPISYDIISGPNEIIKNNEDGILVKNRTIEDLANALKLLLSDDEKRKEMAISGIHNVKRFDQNLITDKWEKLFHHLISEKHA